MQSSSPAVTNRWLLHDVIVGLLAGAGVGLIIGMLISVRVADDNNPISLAGAVIVAPLGIYALIKTHRNAERLVTPTVVIVWLLLVASAIFIIALAYAIATTFQ